MHPTLRPIFGCFWPPFRGLGVWAWLFVAWCFLMNLSGPLYNGLYADSDDMMHLVRAMDLLGGQGWFDPVMYRLAPPQGTEMHFSRILDVPLALLMAPIHWLSGSWSLAGRVAAIVWPMFLLPFYFKSVRSLASFFMTAEWAGLTAVFTLLATPVLFQFSPGRVDHHAPVLLLFGVVFAGILRWMEKPQSPKLAVWIGFGFALMLALALESLPWVFLLFGWCVLWLMIKGQAYARSAVVMSASFLLGTGGCLLALTGADNVLRLSLDSYSGFYLFLAGVTALWMVAVAVASLSSSVVVRFLVGIGVGAGLSFLLFWFIPAFALGPLGGVPPRIYELIFAHISEGIPLVQYIVTDPRNLVTALYPLLGVAVCYYFIRKSDQKSMPRWTLLFLLLLAANGLMLFYQLRFVVMASFLGIVPMTAMGKELWLKINASASVHRKKLTKGIALTILGPLLAVFAPAFVEGRPLIAGTVFFPTQRARTDHCLNMVVGQLLSDPSWLGSKQHTIMNTISEGSPLLLMTPHAVMAAPYHRNALGIESSLDFFSATDDEQAKDILYRTGADLVVMCASVPSIYRSKEQDKLSLAQRLAAGQVPVWLSPVPFPFLERALIFQLKSPS
jgi:hypothetical protein